MGPWRSSSQALPASTLPPCLSMLALLSRRFCSTPGSIWWTPPVPGPGPDQAHSAWQFTMAARPDPPLDCHASLLTGLPAAGWLVFNRPLWLLCLCSIQTIHWLPVILRVEAGIYRGLSCFAALSLLSCPGLSRFLAQPRMLLAVGLCSCWSFHLNSFLAIYTTSSLSKTFQLLLEKPHRSNKPSCAPYLALLNFTFSPCLPLFYLPLYDTISMSPSLPILFTEESPVPRGVPGTQLVFNTWNTSC